MKCIYYHVNTKFIYNNDKKICNDDRNNIIIIEMVQLKTFLSFLLYTIDCQMNLCIATPIEIGFDNLFCLSQHSNFSC